MNQPQPLPTADECSNCNGIDPASCLICRSTTQPLDLDAIQARADAATPGPWHVVADQQDLNRWVTDETGALAFSFGYLGNRTEGDARFVAAARTDVEQLLARVRDLKTEVERLSADRATVRNAIALDLMELHDDPATPDRYRSGLRAAARRIPVAQDGGY
ncbi:hypothetical protein ACIQC7_35200 [Kitasatospora sp. NPDC088556]|uniref:hypothetical protein n=1 Tax=Kitasatospora sp. NPDC088556 TaxID=3364076 RepID=UPI00382A502A